MYASPVRDVDAYNTRRPARYAQSQKLKPPLPSSSVLKRENRPEKSSSPAIHRQSVLGTNLHTNLHTLPDLGLQRMAYAEARKRARAQNEEYFRTRIWEPALKRDLWGSYVFASEQNESDARRFKPGENVAPTEEELQTQREIDVKMALQKLQSQQAAEIQKSMARMKAREARGKARKSFDSGAVSGGQPEDMSKRKSGLRQALAIWTSDDKELKPNFGFNREREVRQPYSLPKALPANPKVPKPLLRAPAKTPETEFLTKKSHKEIAIQRSSNPLALAEKQALQSYGIGSKAPHYTLRAKMSPLTQDPISGEIASASSSFVTNTEKVQTPRAARLNGSGVPAGNLDDEVQCCFFAYTPPRFRLKGVSRQDNPESGPWSA